MSGCSQTVESLFSPADLVLEKQWLKIRDIFFGHNYVKQDIKRALELAAACTHKDAQWLIRVLAGKTVSTSQEARDVFLALGKNDACGLCFAALLSMKIEGDEEEIYALLRRSAELGCALAQAKIAGQMGGEEEFRFASLAASQRERESFHCLGYCFKYGRGCEKNEDKVRENYLIAAELGGVSAMIWFGELLEESDPVRWFWWGQAARRGESYDFLTNFAQQVQEFEAGSNNEGAVFQIGRCLSGNVDVEKRTFFGIRSNFDNRIGPANTAVSFYNSQLSACRRAVDMWSHVGIRCGVVKDIRVLIGKLVWETRDLALFDVREDNAVVNSQMKKC
jgi:hypothetical protein